MTKKELLKKVNWSKNDIASYFNLTKWQLKNAIKKGNIQPLKINSRKYSIPEVLKAFGTTLERELANN